VFKHEGPSRGLKRNAILAAYLALVAGFVDSGGYLLSGAFTSHVTGNIARVSTKAAQGAPGAGGVALLVAAFFCGAVAASLLVESGLFSRRPRAYGTALLVQGGLLALYLTRGQLVVLCVAMGMQNSLVTRLSGAVVRTTHLTGVVTDLGIEAARWLRWGARRGAPPSARPAPSTVALLLIIAGAFTCGAFTGAEAVVRWGVDAMAAPAVAVTVASLYAFVIDGRTG
jgi:uncharacterized membrane protein YoaK (UPF0700 family)